MGGGGPGYYTFLTPIPENALQSWRNGLREEL
jgi:hypothetical protein